MVSLVPKYIISDIYPNNKQKIFIFKAVQLHIQQEKHTIMMTN